MSWNGFGVSFSHLFGALLGVIDFFITLGALFLVLVFI